MPTSKNDSVRQSGGGAGRGLGVMGFFWVGGAETLAMDHKLPFFFLGNDPIGCGCQACWNDGSEQTAGAPDDPTEKEKKDKESEKMRESRTETLGLR